MQRDDIVCFIQKFVWLENNSYLFKTDIYIILRADERTTVKSGLRHHTHVGSVCPQRDPVLDSQTVQWPQRKRVIRSE